jgi:hypothetical protein
VTAPIAEDTGVLPTWLLVPTLVLAAWAAVAPFALADVSWGDVIACFTAPGAVVAGFALADWVVWRRRRRPWHDWTVIVLLLPAIAAAVWLTLGGIVDALALTRGELLGLEVGPGMALVGLLATTVSYHGRHHPDERRVQGTNA